MCVHMYFISIDIKMHSLLLFLYFLILLHNNSVNLSQLYLLDTCHYLSRYILQFVVIILLCKFVLIAVSLSLALSADMYAVVFITECKQPGMET